jgi:hypothetical protein
MILSTIITLVLVSVFSAHVLPTADALVAQVDLRNDWCTINLHSRKLEYLNTAKPRRLQIYDVGFIDGVKSQLSGLKSVLCKHSFESNHSEN